jgi:hypothetical protein
VPDERTDPDLAVRHRHAVQAGKAVDVDEQLRGDEAGGHHRDQALAAREDLRVAPVRRQQVERLAKCRGPAVRDLVRADHLRVSCRSPY